MSNINQDNIKNTARLIKQKSDESNKKSDSRLGSWVKRGIDELLGLNLSRDLVRILRRWDGMSDPITLMRSLQSFSRGQIPVGLPGNLSGEELKLLKNLALDWYDYFSPKLNDNNLYKGISKIGPFNEGRELVYTDKIESLRDGINLNYNEDKVVKIHNSESLNNYKESIKRYNWVFNDPYSGSNSNSITYANPDELIKKLNNEGFKFGIGYKYIKGFEMGSLDNWNIQIYPYKQNPTKGVNIPSYPKDRYSVVPELPSYILPNIDGNSTGIRFSYSTYCPILSWSLQWGTIDSMDIPLFNGSNIQIPFGFKYNMILSLRILDDVYLSMDKYMRHYINSIYNPQRSLMAPYWASAFWIPITIFRRGYEINYRFNLICVPVQWSPSMDNADSSSEQSVQIEFSVIGLQLYTDGNKNVYANSNTPLNNYKLSWKDITLRPN